MQAYDGYQNMAQASNIAFVTIGPRLPSEYDMGAVPTEATAATSSQSNWFENARLQHIYSGQYTRVSC